MSDLFTFKDWLDNLSKLTDDERKELLKRLSDMEDETNRIIKEKGLYTNSDGEIISCPHCGSTHIGIHGNKNGKLRYRCKEKECRKTFMETTRTFYGHSKLSDWQWKELLRGIVEGKSITQMANDTGLSTKTIWFNKNKVEQMITARYGNQDRFVDIAECDETFVHLSYKGKRDPRFFVYKLKRLPRHHRNRAEKIEYLKKYGLWEELQDNPRFLEYLLSADKRSQTSLAGTNEDSVCVLAGIDRNQNIYIKPACVGGLETTHVTKHFSERFAPDAVLVTDGNATYNWFAELSMIHHEAIPADKHAVGPYNLARVNALHGNYKAYYPKHKQNLPATKYLDLGTDFFWWLEKNKDKTTQEKVDILYKMMKEETSSVKYRDLTRRKLDLDTKGLIPTEL